MYSPGQYEYQMGYTLTEFSRTVLGDFTRKSAQFECTQISANKWQVVSADGTFSVSITAQQKSPRTIALLQLPVLQVKFIVQFNDDRQVERQFFERFFKYFHKGGG